MSVNYQTKSFKPSLRERAAAELELRRRRLTRALPPAWADRVPLLFPSYFWHPFSEPHQAVWSWADAIRADQTCRPFIGIWSRGRGKSTNAEAITADVGVREARTYALYISGTQAQADKHVATIARMLESDAVAQHAPTIGRPRVSQNGNRSWNRQMLTTATGYTVEAIGLDKAIRGQKIDWARPDFLVFDDIDERHDSALTRAKKQEIITDSIIPAGAAHAAVLFMQNLIYAGSIADSLSKPADDPVAAHFLLDRLISGPYKAVEDLTYTREEVDGIWRWRLQGRSLWAGYDLQVCEDEFNRVGPASFLRESQHEVDGDADFALLTQAEFDATRVDRHPDLARVVIAVDPPGGATACGIVAVGKAWVGNDWHGYTLEDATTAKGSSPETWALAVLQCYARHRADAILIERNYGGDMVAATLRQTKWLDDEGRVIVDGAKVKITEVVATRGKVVRAEPVAIVFQQGRGHHVGQLTALEKEWRQYVPGTKDSPNRLDAEVWAYVGLDLVGEQRAAVSQAKVRGRSGRPMVRTSTRRVA